MQDFLRNNYVFLAVGRVGSASENVLQKVVWVEEHDKRNFLMDLLDAGDAKCKHQECLCSILIRYRLLTAAPDALTLVFTETKRGAADLCYYLENQKYNVVAIHGDLKQYERERHLERFRAGSVRD